MAVIRLQGINKEIYIRNLLSATKFLKNVIKEDKIFKISEWDRIVYDEVAKRLDLIIDLFYFLQRTTDKDKDNFGIYIDLVLSNGGLPEFFSYRQLKEDKNNADEKISSILESEGIASKEELAKKWIDTANNRREGNKEYKKTFLLNIIPDKYQAIEFHEKLKMVSLFDIEKPMDYLSVKLVGNDEGKNYIISWFNYVLGNGVWNIYVAKICEKPEKKLSFFNRRDNKIIDDNKIDDVFKKFLENHMNSGAFFLAREIDKNFTSIYPERIAMFQFGPNFVEGIKLGEYSQLFKTGDFFLTAQREDIENSGKNLDRKNRKNRDGKYIWRADKLIEERFGICSKELEKSLKENILIPNMRFYVLKD